MNRFKGSVKGTGFRSLAFCSLLLAGCAGQKSFWGDPSSGLILRYRTPETALRYREFRENAAEHDIRRTALSDRRGFAERDAR